MAESTEMVELLGGRSKKSSDSEYSWNVFVAISLIWGFLFGERLAAWTSTT